MKTLKKIAFWSITVIIVVISVFIYFKYEFTYSKGYRAGLLQKFSEKGMVFKTYEGEMVLSSVQSDANVAIASEKFLFSVTDKTVAKSMEQIQGRRVVVHYMEKKGALPCGVVTVIILLIVSVLTTLPVARTSPTDFVPEFFCRFLIYQFKFFIGNSSLNVRYSIFGVGYCQYQKKYPLPATFLQPLVSNVQNIKF